MSIFLSKMKKHQIVTELEVKPAGREKDEDPDEHKPSEDEGDDYNVNDEEEDDDNKNKESDGDQEQESDESNSTDYNEEEESEPEDTGDAQTLDSGEDTEPQEDTGGEDEGDDYGSEEDTDDGNIPDDTEPQEDTGGEDEGDDYGSEEDTDDSSEDYSDTEDSSSDSNDEESNSDESGENTPASTDDLKSLEDQIFSSLSPDKLAIKHLELKTLFIDMHESISNTIGMVNKIPKTNKNIPTVEFLVKKLTELKETVNYHITKVYNTKTYFENNQDYQFMLAILNNISDILEELSKTAKEDKKSKK